MSISDSKLDQLFSQAREEKPVVSYEESQKAFIVATVTAAGGVLATKGLLKLLTLKKWIIMISTVSIVTTGAIVVSVASAQPNKEEPVNEPAAISSTTTEEVVMPKELLEPKLEEETLFNYEDSLKEPVEEVIEPTEVIVITPPSKVYALMADSEILFTGVSNDLPDTIEPTILVWNEEGEFEARVFSPTEKIIPYSERFAITQNTSKEELEEIKKHAEDAGIEFDYSVSYKKDQIRKLSIRMKIKDDKGGYKETLVSNMSFSGDFSYIVGWSADDDGKATQLRCGDEDAIGTLDEELLEEALMEYEIAMSQINWDSLSMELDSLGYLLDLELSESLSVLEIELAKCEVELERALNEFQSEDIHEMIDRILEESEEMIQQLEEEMEELHEELERREAEEEKKEREREEEEQRKERDEEDENDE